MLEKIAEFNFWHKTQDTGTRREELKDALEFVEIRDTAFVLTGVRRCGKSYLSKQILAKKINQGIAPEQTLYVNFEDKEIEPFINEKILDEIYSSYRAEINPDKFAIVVLDEVDKVPNWERWVRSMLERKENIKIIVTGSGSKIITPNLATILTGRKITYTLFPLSFSGFLKFKGVKIKSYEREKTKKLLLEYLKYGGFPLVVFSEKPIQKNAILQEIYDDILTKDILIRFRLREEQILKKVSYLVLNSFAKPTSIRKIRNSLQSLMKASVSPSTLSYYFEYFSLSFLYIFLPIFSYNIKDQEQYPKKVYCIDSGIINSILPKFSENIGRIIENVVAIELMRRKTKTPEMEIFYFRSDEQEADFVVKQGLDIKQIIQVTYASGKDEIEKREIKALIKASEELKCKNLLCITWDYEGEEKIDRKKVKFMPLWKWLLNVK
ncbi:MAG: ATP-binding protein [Candidatus Aenigmatarchaeota archaeon]|nr:MAG: ATP-binding protein [Candidatus Aenigmarchaeota archaeon]